MSDNPLMAPDANLNALQTAAQNAPAQPPPPQGLTPDKIAHLVSGANRGRTQEQMIQRRDAAGPELDILGKIMADPDPKPDEVKEYLLAGMKSGQIPAGDAIKIINSIPPDPDELRTWAKTMFGVVMHIGIHAHAAFPRELFPSAAPQEAGEVPEGESE